jgi:hypothetical protein
MKFLFVYTITGQSTAIKWEQEKTHTNKIQKQDNLYNLIIITPWPESASELYRPSNRRLSVKLVPIFEDTGGPVVNVKDLYGSILGFLDRSLYFFIQVAPQLYSRGLVDPVPDPLFRKSSNSGNRTRGSGSVAINSGH